MEFGVCTRSGAFQLIAKNVVGNKDVSREVGVKNTNTEFLYQTVELDDLIDRVETVKLSFEYSGVLNKALGPDMHI